MKNNPLEIMCLNYTWKEKEIKELNKFFDKEIKFICITKKKWKEKHV